VGEISGSMRSWPGLNRAIADVYNSTFIEGDLPPNGLLAKEQSDIAVTPDMWLAAADGVSANLELENDAAVLRLAGAALRAEKRAAPLFKSVCDGNPFRLRDVAAQADASALTDLAQELVRRRVLVIKT
jgi:hypothetical protein